MPDYISEKEHIKQKGYKEGTVGHPLPGVAVKVVDPDTYKPLPPDTEGLLLVKGSNVMLGYLKDDEKTREVTVRFMPCAKKARPDLYEQWEEAFNAKNIIVRD